MRDIVKIEISCSSLVQVTNTQHNLYLFQSGEWNFISRGWEPESIIECTRTVYVQYQLLHQEQRSHGH